MARVVITGGAGFLGSHLVGSLLAARRPGRRARQPRDRQRGEPRIVPGQRTAFTFIHCDVSREVPVAGRVDTVMHFASPASPRYLELPIETLEVGSLGTRLTLELAREHRCRYVLASTSEVYGDPLVHPQREDYWGNVNPCGVRSVYDEAKRFAEALAMAYCRTHGLSVGIVRIFNTYGPRLQPANGRVVSNLLLQAMQGRPLTIYGDGTQTRSFCYVDDEIRGIIALLDSDVTGPVNIGNADEFTVLELAKSIVEITATTTEIVYLPLPADDPTQRCPDLTRARQLLGWQPEVSLATGLRRTHEWYRAMNLAARAQ